MSNVKIFTDNIEQEALDQINTLVAQPAFSDCKIRIMPDVHAGAGCVIGFTADLGEKVIPNIVGVDIGCGMLTFCLGKIDIDFSDLDRTIRAWIPSGREVHETPRLTFTGLYSMRCLNKIKTDRVHHSIGTLGGGNHFIEIDQDEVGNKYLVIHTGSRNLGKQVADYYQKKAIDNLSGKGALKEAQRKLVAEYKKDGRDSELESAIKELRTTWKKNNIPDELCYLTGTDREDYLHDMRICQIYANVNRTMIASIIADAMGWTARYVFETVHNYIEDGTNMIRKGAISAKHGERVLIPINMRDGCIIGIGKGNPDWNYSAPHGAGRIMSRRKARECVSIDEYKKSMENVFTTSVSMETIDESPMAYKSMGEIVENIKDTIEIEKIIKPIYNFKAGE